MQVPISQGYPLWLVDSCGDVFIVVGWTPAPIWGIGLAPMCVPASGVRGAAMKVPAPGAWTLHTSEPLQP